MDSDATDQLSYLLFYVVELTLLIAPLLMFGAFVIIRKFRRSALTPIAAVCAVILLVVAGFCALGFSFSAIVPNFITLSIAFTAYCFLAACTPCIRRIYLRIAALILALLPICLGYFVATFGFGAVLLLILDATGPPEDTGSLGPSLTCEDKSWGMAITDEGDTIHVYKSWPNIPFIRRDVLTMKFDDSDSDEDYTSPDATNFSGDVLSCKAVLAYYAKRK